MGKRGGVEVLARAGSGEGEKGRVRLGGCNGEEEGGNEKGEMGRGQQEGGDGEGHKGEGRRRGKREGISQMDMMKCLGGTRLQFFLTLFTVQRRVPQLVYTNKTGDCLSFFLSVCLSVRLWTAKPLGLTG